MKTPQKKPIEPLENEVLRRMLHTPPTPHKPIRAKAAPAKKPSKS